ncbi:hypothetical protein ASE01_20520 [Nocardioides sp. Root190]|uniref:hypothetical protein n=1 Tax=Nocardioides sp. Root190 TaxID=1736488 RepID=UPI0006F92208|nr:hypothetical protein [Nocardioides sp. Root190]KRB73152.1 hypothetical protein ASE01_20520 [Nocardioides sp. Root190]
MIQEVNGITAASSWVGLFAAVWLNRTTQEEQSQRPARRAPKPTCSAAPPSAGDESEAQICSDVLALIQPLTRSSSRRFDDFVAIPLDAPHRLDEIIRIVGVALTRLPPTHQLSHRTVLARANLERIARDAIRARTRLADGTYGTCTDCSGPISLFSLSEKPWTPRCIYCALDI